MPATEFRVISVDPAPSKNSTVFDSIDGFLELDAFELDEHLNKARRLEQSVLLAWDAPLTGPWLLDSVPKVKSEDGNPGDFSPFYERAIERELRGKYGRKTIDGKAEKIVSVLGYAGCPHWTITRAILGLPRVGRYCLPESSLPFTLLTDNKRPDATVKRRYVVETHPALAMAMLFRTNAKTKTQAEAALQRYKRKEDTSAEGRREAVATLKKAIGRWCIRNEIGDLSDSFERINDDDQLDAFVGFLLAKLWINGSKLIEVRGGIKEGAILLPVVGKPNDEK